MSDINTRMLFDAWYLQGFLRRHMLGTPAPTDEEAEGLVLYFENYQLPPHLQHKGVSRTGQEMGADWRANGGQLNEPRKPDSRVCDGDDRRRVLEFPTSPPGAA